MSKFENLRCMKPSGEIGIVETKGTEDLFPKLCLLNYAWHKI